MTNIVLRVIVCLPCFPPACHYPRAGRADVSEVPRRRDLRRRQQVLAKDVGRCVGQVRRRRNGGAAEVPRGEAEKKERAQMRGGWHQRSNYKKSFLLIQLRQRFTILLAEAETKSVALARVVVVFARTLRGRM